MGIKICENCHREFNRKKRFNLNWWKTAKYCSTTCFGISRLGKPSPTLGRQMSEEEKINCKGRLEAHHILSWKDYPELRYDINNGITLCHAHHPRKRDEEAELSPYFQSLVAEMK